MLEGILLRVLQLFLGSGANISTTNPVPVTMAELPMDSGTATAGSGTTCEDTTKDWEVNMWADFVIEVDIGGVEYHRTIISNTNDTLTFNALGGLIVVAAGDEYEIRTAGATPPGVVNVDSYTNTGNIAPAVVRSTATDPFSARKVTIHWSVATSNPVTIALDAAAGVAYDTVLRIVTMGANQDMVYYFPESAKFVAADVITVAWTDDTGGVGVWGVQIGWE